MGILDYLFTTGDYKREQENRGLLQEAAQRWQGPQVSGLVEPDGPNQPGGIQTLPGGLMNPQATSRFAVDAVASGFPAVGGNMLTQQMRNQQAEEQHLRERNWAMQDQQRYGGYKSLNERMGAENTIYDDYYSNVKPYETAFQYGDYIKQTVVDRKGVENFSPADDLVLLTAFNKYQRPQEAMQKDDVENARDAGGYWGLSETMINDIVAGKGQGLPDKLRKQMINTMRSMETGLQKSYDSEHTRLKERATRGNMANAVPGQRQFTQFKAQAINEGTANANGNPPVSMWDQLFR